MRKLTKIATESDIESSIPPGKKTQRLNFGRGLYMRKDSGGRKYFQFRMRINGKEKSTPLGQHPDISLIDAKAKAEIFRSKVLGARRENRESDFVKSLSKRKDSTPARKTGCLKSIADARDLFQILSSQDPRNEIYPALQLMLLIPVVPERLIKAKLGEFTSGSNAPIWNTAPIWITAPIWNIAPMEDVYSGKTKASEQYLAIKAIDILWPLSAEKNNSEFLFRSLSSLKAGELKESLQRALDKIWTIYPVRVSCLREAFREFSISESQFRSSLIKEAMVSQGSSSHRAPYQIQRTALAEWWASQINWPYHLFNSHISI